MNVPGNVRYVIALVLFNTHIILSATAHNVLDGNASSHSVCRKLSSTSIDCSNLMLTAVPKDIPNTTLTLDLSFNNIKLDESTFALCCRNLRELNLSSNEISSINQDYFKNLPSLTKLILRNNSIGEFDPETFSDLPKLEHLDLSKNPLVLQKIFINNSKLTDLNLDSCGLSEIPEDAFSGIKQLESLTLTNNPLDEEFDSSAFDDLQSSLTKLEIKNVSRGSITELCNRLTAIDTINFEGFNFSCYIYIAEENFDDAIVGNDPPYEQPLTLPRVTAPPKTTTTLSTTEQTTMSIQQNTTVTEIIFRDQSEKKESKTDVKTTTETADYTVDVDNETLKYILIGILAVTLTGILVGLICRADVFGIKTKMCRSNKKASNNRREPADTVSPFEEIPLNTVTVNSNGKTIEGQG